MAFPKIAAVIALCAGALAFGQAPGPATRPSTAGRIAPTIRDVAPRPVGAQVPAVTLVDSDGKPFDLRAAILKKPTVLVWYRGGFCQNCMRQLRGIESVLPELSEAGYQVIAISPDVPERARITIADFGITYTILSDSKAEAMKAFGVAHVAEPRQFETLELASGGATHHAMPVPAIYLLWTDGTIRFEHLDPDYTNKLEYSDLVGQAKAALLK